MNILKKNEKWKYFLTKFYHYCYHYIVIYLAHNKNATKFSREVYEKKLNRFVEECEMTKQVYHSVKHRLRMSEEDSFIPPNEREEGLDEKVDKMISLKN